MFKQFDIVRLKTTKKIKWLSGPAGAKTSPNGDWSVVASVGNELILCKDSTLVKAPTEDIQKVANYNLEKLFRRKKDGQIEEEKSDSKR